MTPHKQLFRHEPDKGVWGDCFRTTIACLLDLAPEDVPHFCDNGVQQDVATSEARVWMAAMGLAFVDVPFGGQDDVGAVLSFMGSANPGLHYILTGQSRTGCAHAVVCKDGKIVHDPSLTESGIVGPCEVDRVFWVSFIAKLL